MNICGLTVGQLAGIVIITGLLVGTACLCAAVIRQVFEDERPRRFKNR